MSVPRNPVLAITTPIAATVTVLTLVLVNRDLLETEQFVKVFEKCSYSGIFLDKENKY